MTPANRDVGDVELWVRGVCTDLGLEVPERSGDFFAAGGTSLTAIKLISRAEEVFGEGALPPDALYTESGFQEIALTIVRGGAHEHLRDEAR